MEEGDMINPMMGMGSSVLTLMDLNKVKIILDVSSENIEKIKIGQDCLTSVYSLENEIFKGEVYSKNLAADPISKTFKIEVKILNPGIRIKAGVFAEVRVEILTKKDTLKLPLSALISNTFVVVYESGRAKNVPIKVGEKNEEEFEILSGLTEGELVVVEGNYDLKEGTLISIEGASQ
jgi:RND family efflux transporter MFP subunit